MSGSQGNRGAGIAQIELYIPKLFVDMAEQGTGLSRRTVRQGGRRQVHRRPGTAEDERTGRLRGQRDHGA